MYCKPFHFPVVHSVKHETVRLVNTRQDWSSGPRTSRLTPATCGKSLPVQDRTSLTHLPLSWPRLSSQFPCTCATQSRRPPYSPPQPLRRPRRTCTNDKCCSYDRTRTNEEPHENTQNDQARSTRRKGHGPHSREQGRQTRAANSSGQRQASRGVSRRRSYRQARCTTCSARAGN